MKLVQIKGSNGSGKTTIVKQLLHLDGYGGDPYLRTSQGDIYATVNPNVGWAAIGKYDTRAMGGCDRLRTVDQIKASVELTVCWALKHPDLMYGVVYEGMMISTIKSTFYAFGQRMQEKYGVDPIFVILEAIADGCVRRIDHRGTKRAGLKIANVHDKCVMVKRHGLTYKPELVRWIDVENTSEADMVVRFLEAIGDTELLELC